MERSGQGPRVAVIIVAYNAGTHLCHTIDALARQTYRDFEAIVWDNASADGSATGAMLRDNMRYVRSEQNLGFAAGNNAAIRQTHAELIALLNPDVVPEPHWLERLVAAIDNQPHAVMAASRQLNAADPTILDGIGDVFHVSGVGYRGGFGSTSALVVGPGEVFSPCAAAALYRRDAFEAVGGFDERYFCYFEDVDLAFRLRLAGGSCEFVPDAVVHHVGSASMGQYSEFVTYHGVRNRIWTIAKDVPWPLLALTAPLHAAILIVQMAKAPLRGAAVFRGTWRGIRDGLAGLSQLLEDRRRIQADRVTTTREIARAMTWSPLALLRRAPDVRARRPAGRSLTT